MESATFCFKDEVREGDPKESLEIRSVIHFGWPLQCNPTGRIIDVFKRYSTIKLGVKYDMSSNVSSQCCEKLINLV